VEYSLCESGFDFVTPTASLTGDPALDASYQLTDISRAINAGNNDFLVMS
jgi:hypothetical protein